MILTSLSHSPILSSKTFLFLANSSSDEEQLIKNKRFAKKNFQSLEDLVPKLAAAMMKTKNGVNIII